MADDLNRFAVTDRQRRWVALIGEIADRHAEGVRIADKTNELNLALIHDLRPTGYYALAVPETLGGLGFSVYEYILCQERIARVDAPSALAIGWHHTVLYDLGQTGAWERTAYESLCAEVVNRGALINRAESERANGSPSRGGRPQTVATRTGDGYILNGRKSFTSLAPALDFFIVTAVDEETDQVAEFLIPKETPGASIDPVWDMLGMRGTASHDLVLDNARVPLAAKVHVRTGASKRPNPFMLNMPAVYLGIAGAARDEAIAFASRYQPNSLDRPIVHLPHIRDKIGRIELELTAARNFMYSVAERWDWQSKHMPDQLHLLQPELSAVKMFAVQSAISIVDTAMRVFGIHGLSNSSPMQRLYRDVRFGLSNPPMDDVTLGQLADRAISEVARMTS